MQIFEVVAGVACVEAADPSPHVGPVEQRAKWLPSWAVMPLMKADSMLLKCLYSRFLCCSFAHGFLSSHWHSCSWLSVPIRLLLFLFYCNMSSPHVFSITIMLIDALVHLERSHPRIPQNLEVIGFLLDGGLVVLCHLCRLAALAPSRCLSRFANFSLSYMSLVPCLVTVCRMCSCVSL